jgi:hypothetical protein
MYVYVPLILHLEHVHENPILMTAKMEYDQSKHHALLLGLIAETVVSFQ